MKYKLLISDIDETLVHNSGSVSKENAEAINRAREAGIYVALATGRGYYGSSRVLKQLELSGYVINYGGAMITDPIKGEPVYVSSLENEYIQEILQMAYELGLHAHIYQNDCVIYETPDRYVKKYIGTLELPNRMEPHLRQKHWKDVPKVLIITEPERVDELLPVFLKRFDGRVYVSASSPGFIEFNRLGTNKGAAAAMLADMLGIARDETAAIGDNTLDLELIKWAGLSAAVGNGNVIVKAAADVITPSCEANGVAWFIDNYILHDI